MEAYEYSAKHLKYPRVEPLMAIVEHYYNANNYQLASMFCEKACSLNYPEKNILFVNRTQYDYTRWWYMASLGYQTGNQKLGKEACNKAQVYAIRNQLTNGIPRFTNLMNKYAEE